MTSDSQRVGWWTHHSSLSRSLPLSVRLSVKSSEWTQFLRSLKVRKFWFLLKFFPCHIFSRLRSAWTILTATKGWFTGLTIHLIDSAELATEWSRKQKNGSKKQLFIIHPAKSSGKKEPPQPMLFSSRAQQRKFNIFFEPHTQHPVVSFHSDFMCFSILHRAHGGVVACRRTSPFFKDRNFSDRSLHAEFTCFSWACLSFLLAPLVLLHSTKTFHIKALKSPSFLKVHVFTCMFIFISSQSNGTEVSWMDELLIHFFLVYTMP